MPAPYLLDTTVLLHWTRNSPSTAEMRCHMPRAMLVVIGVVLLAIPVAQTQTRVGGAADEAAIKKNGDARSVAWNKHDAKALAALFAADADRVSARGVKSGRVEIEKDYADEFGSVYKDAVLKDESNKVRFLTADVAILDADHVITGRTDGTIKNHVTAIYVKRNGTWALVAYRVIRMQ